MGKEMNFKEVRNCTQCWKKENKFPKGNMWAPKKEGNKSALE